jgi:hypothetical protein
MIRRGELAAIQIGRSWRISPEAIAAAELGPLAVMPKVRRRRATILNHKEH